MRRSMISFGVMVAAAMATPAEAAPEDDYARYCVTCHGKDGKGQTKMGEKLAIKDLTDPRVQAEFSDEEAFQNIAEGVKDAQTGKARMPARKDKLTVEQMRDLVKLVRAFNGSSG